MSFSSNQWSVGTTAVELASAADFDREVLLSQGGAVDIRLAFASTQVTSGVKLSELLPADGPLRYILPSGHGLWAKAESGTATINLVLTKPGGAR